MNKPRIHLILGCILFLGIGLVIAPTFVYASPGGNGVNNQVNIQGEPANLLSPIETNVIAALPGQKIVSSNTTFKWSKGNEANIITVMIGNETNLGEYFYKQYYPPFTEDSVTVSDIPLNGEPLNVRIITFAGLGTGAIAHAENYIFERAGCEGWHDVTEIQDEGEVIADFCHGECVVTALRRCDGDVNEFSDPNDEYLHDYRLGPCSEIPDFPLETVPFVVYDAVSCDIPAEE